MTVIATTGASSISAAATDLAPAMLPETEASPVIVAPLRVDVAIVGAGPVGLALAGWLTRRGATRALSVALIDARDASQIPHATNADPRAMALSHGSRMLLETLGWPGDATSSTRSPRPPPTPAPPVLTGPRPPPGTSS